MVRHCSIEGCEKKHYGQGWCKAHYLRWWKHGDPNISKRRQAGTCSVEGCDRPGYGNGYCASHFGRWMRNGDPLAGRYRMSTDGPCLVDGCNKPRHGKGYCNDHHHRLLKHGDPLAGGTFRGDPLKWLQEHVNYQGDECLTWPFATGPGGGRVWFNGKLHLATRVMCLLAHGEPPTDTHEAAHYCGKGHEACTNPRHLGWETLLANEAHKVGHGTLVWGEKSNFAKIRADEVRFIRLHPEMTRRQLAERFSVSMGTIGDIRARRSWKLLDV